MKLNKTTAPIVPAARRGPRAEYQRFESVLAPGHYLLSGDFVGSRVDKRLGGPGWESRVGFRQGTRFTIREAVWTYHDDCPPEHATNWELSPIFLGHVHALSGRKRNGEECIVWSCPPAVEVGRLLSLLVPDTSDQTWLDHAVGHGFGTEGYFRPVLLALLADGRVSREEIAEVVRTQEEALVAQERERRREIGAGEL